MVGRVVPLLLYIGFRHSLNLQRREKQSSRKGTLSTFSLHWRSQAHLSGILASGLVTYLASSLAMFDGRESVHSIHVQCVFYFSHPEDAGKWCIRECTIVETEWSVEERNGMVSLQVDKSAAKSRQKLLYCFYFWRFVPDWLAPLGKRL